MFLYFPTSELNHPNIGKSLPFEWNPIHELSFMGHQMDHQIHQMETYPIWLVVYLPL